MPDEQDRAEALDDDRLPDQYPPSQPLGALRGQDEARTEPEADGDRPVRREEEIHSGVTSDGEVIETPESAEEAALHLRAR